MLERMHQNLLRQEKALEYLKILLEEEFSHLRGHDPQAVVGVEFSIHELLRQIAAERRELKRISVQLCPNVKTIHDLLGEIDPEEAERLREVVDRADRKEQTVAVLAERNAYLARGLMEQSRNMLEFLHEKIQPRSENTYSAGGRFSKSRPRASLMSGRT